ncbi:hypothetical protein TL16_g12625 [Triparma laevis f. inornata]|uniref:Uncharacterized protein n=1 Tax=Triparma laevis f. inornata TaxID=1714386 RepID=A0A9W7BTU9_9STRA|nr:hypothetical protein TL16_g12625 [Triparma laevis f. inornata]
MAHLVPAGLEDVGAAYVPEVNPLYATDADANYKAQRERVLTARETVKNLKNETVPNQVVTLHGKGNKVLEGHRIVPNADAVKYPNANWEARPANFHDYEALQARYADIKEEKRRLAAYSTSLQGRLDDSNSALATLTEKRRLLANAKDMSDFKVDLGVGSPCRDGWLAVPPPPKADPLARQVNALEMKLVNKEMAKSMRDLEEFAISEEKKALLAEQKLKQRKDKLSTFPSKVVQNIEEVQRQSISLIDEKAALEQKRSSEKRKWAKIMSEARSELSKIRDVVSDSSDELSSLRDDLKYWNMRLKIEKVKVEPVRAEVERLKSELNAVSAGEGMSGGWQSVVMKSAFLQGSNMDLAGLVDSKATRYSDITDKLYLRRVAEVVRAHLFPAITNVGMKEVRDACDGCGVWYDEEGFEESKVGEEDFYKIVKQLREMREF